jgi:hypothetical protein
VDLTERHARIADVGGGAVPQQAGLEHLRRLR